MKRQTFLLCLVAVMVSLFSLSQVSFTKSPPAPDPNNVNYFDSSLFFRANPSVDIQYADDLYWYLFEMDDSTFIRVNETVTLFSISSIDASKGTVTFTASGNDAQYLFAWSPSDPYIKSVEGTVTSLNIAEYADDKLTLTIVASSGTTSTTKVYGGSKGEPLEVSSTGSIQSESYNEATQIKTVSVLHGSSEVLTFDWSPDVEAGGAEEAEAGGIPEPLEPLEPIPTEPIVPTDDFWRKHGVVVIGAFVLVFTAWRLTKPKKKRRR